MLAATMSCGGNDGPTAPTLILSLRAPDPLLVPGQTTALELAATRNGQPVSTTGALFASSSPSVAAVSGNGVVTAVALGTTTLTAQLNGQQATASVAVRDGGILTPAGGVLRTSGGEIEVTAPSGAVESPTPVAIALTAGSPWVDPTLVRGSVFTLGRDGQRFARPLTVRVRYVAANAPYGLPQSALGVRRALPTSAWVDLHPSVVDSATGYVTASTTDAGTFSVGRLVPTTPCIGPAYRAFDFWVGAWNMTDRGQAAGENFITAESGGCAIFENYITATNLSPGRSVSFYNPATDRWYQTYIDAGNNMVLLRSTSYADGAIPMVSVPQGNAFTRTTWTRNGDGSVRQLIEGTGNNGQTFVVQYDILYRRK